MNQNLEMENIQKQIRDVQQEMEELRKQMQDIASKLGLLNEEVLHVSQKLDKKIVHFMQLRKQLEERKKPTT